MSNLWLKHPTFGMIPVGGGGEGGGGSDGYTYVQDTTPTGASDGQTWFDTSTGNTFVFYQDADSSQWVMDNGGGGGSGGETVESNFFSADVSGTSVPANTGAVLLSTGDLDLPAGRYRVDAGIDSGFTVDTANTEIYFSIWNGAGKLAEVRTFNTTVNLKAMPFSVTTAVVDHPGGVVDYSAAVHMGPAAGQAYGRAWILVAPLDRPLSGGGGGPTITPWANFTPTWTNYTRGNGTVVAKFRYVGDSIEFWVDETVGSTSSFVLEPQMEIPDGATPDPDLLAFDVGRVYMRDAGVQTYAGTVLWTPDVQRVRLRPFGASADWATNGSGVSATVPFTWAAGDSIRLFAALPVVR